MAEPVPAHSRQIGPLLVVAALVTVGVVTVAGSFAAWWWLDGRFGPDVPLDELVAGQPIIQVSFDGEVDRAEIAALAAARGTDEALLQRWYDLLLRTDGTLVVAGDGWVRLELDIDDRHAMTLDVDPSQLPDPGQEPQTVLVRLDLGADGLAAATAALTGQDTAVGDVVQRLLWTRAGPLLDESVTGGRARVEVDVEVAGAAGLSWLDGGGTGGTISARGGQLELPADLLAAITDVLLAVPARGVLSSSVDAPVDLGPTTVGGTATVPAGEVMATLQHVIEDADVRFGTGPTVRVDLVALLAAGLRDRGDQEAAAVVEGWETTTLGVVLRRVGQGPDELHVRDDSPRVSLPQLLEPAPPAPVGDPDEIAMRELAQGIDFLAAGAQKRRMETGAYPDTITELVRASDLAVDPVHPLSTLGWLYRVGAAGVEDLCIEARHETGAVWSARASDAWMAAEGAC